MPQTRLLSNKKTFTLLEVMVAICIFSMIASASGWRIFRMISSYRFSNQVANCFSSLQYAQALALVYQTDLTFEIFSEKNIYYYRILSDEPFPSSVLDKTKKHSLSGVKICKYNDHFFTNKKWEVSSSGLIEPRGVIYLAKEEDGLWIDLQKGFLVQCKRTKPT